MRTSSVFWVLLLAGATACDRTAAPVEPAPSAPSAAVAMQAGPPHGVLVDLAAPAVPPPAGAMVYVYLREPGERMPLAVQHFDAAELPKRVSFLGDSPRGNVELVARLSRSGRVERSEGDVEVVHALDALGHPPSRLQITFDAVPAAARPPEIPAAPPIAVRVRVSADGVRFPADGVVLVVARAPGERMPLAVKKLVFAELPAELVLTDDDAMTYSKRLSTASTISLSLSARLSRSGGAARGAGDLESATVEVAVDALPERVELTIPAAD